MRRLLAVPLAIALLMGVATPVYAGAESDAADKIVSLTNTLRDNNGKSTLSVKDGLTSVADKWSEKQLDGVVTAWKKYLNGGSLDVPMKHNPNYSSQIPDGWTSAGENVGWACGYSTAVDAAKAIQKAWKNSEGHLENMLGSYSHIGVGFAWDSGTGCAFATQNFGKYPKASAVLGTSSSLFSDVYTSDSAYKAIMWIASEDIAKGYSDGTFRPGTGVSRRQMASFLYKLAGKPDFDVPSTSPYSDVKKSDSAYKAIAWLDSTGIAKGYSDGTFRPSDKVSRRQMASFLYKFADKPSVSLPSTSPYWDLKKSDSAYKAIVWLDSTGIAKGYSDGSFKPGSKVSRRQMSSFLYRYSS
ncbi:S-layer homology domain-containing protein [Demequina sp. NBRC 110054]|uniref:CAP and S-layer homology domain-containing protein n=1 Tax=Demequina sp. NBRC 110054 TaxID=1570343 RepID=UPI0009FD48A6|nr:S-layer homology domain-containing protein [Demequina sp. NBRC 110054]